MIGPSIKIKGEVSGDEDLLIQGQVEGTVSLKSNEVIVGESGQVSADILAKTIKIDGKVTGDITGTENGVISRLGNVRGNIIAPRVLLEDGHLEVLDSERCHFDSELSLARSIRDELFAYVLLYRAFGGGWQGAEEIAATGMQAGASGLADSDAGGDVDEDEDEAE